MQLEEKLVDGREAAREESQHREDMEEHREETLPGPMTEAMHDATLELRGQLLGAIRMILDRQTLAVGLLHVPQREMRGLEALQVAVNGREGIGLFVFASDRRDLLEQALAVLQPNLTHADDLTARELHGQLADLTARVGELRDRLTDLEDAQDELLEGRDKASLEEGVTDPSDKPKPSDPDAPRPATTLTGPERPEPAKSVTTLVGPERPEPARPATTLDGPERREPPRPGTTLVGPELPELRKPATTLTGADLPPEAPRETSLGDSEEIAAKPKRPWWRRPFG